MPTLYLRDVPAGVVAALKRRAKTHRRSLNAEAVDVLSEAVRPKVSIDEVLDEIRANVEEMGLTKQEVDDLMRANREERDARPHA